MKTTNFCWNIEKIENYNLAKADNFKDWVIHHKLETQDSNGNLRKVELTSNELIVNNVNGHTYVGKRKLYKKAWNEDGYIGYRSGRVL